MFKVNRLFFVVVTRCMPFVMKKQESMEHGYFHWQVFYLTIDDVVFNSIFVFKLIFIIKE